MRKAFIILCLTAFSATAQADLAQNLLACARIADDARRLACYDRFATEVIEIGLSGQTQGTAAPAIGAGATAGAAASASPSPAPAAPASSAPVASPDPAPAAQPPSTQTASASPEDNFGKDTSGDGPKKVKSRVVGEFTGWDGKTIFRLENGQVWQQAEQGRMSWRAENPEVTVSRGLFGVYRLSVKGVNKKIKVKRIE